MRMFPGAAALLFLAACDDGGAIDQTIKAGVRQSAIEVCLAWVPQSDIAAAAGLDGQRLCACAADHILEGKKVSELPEFRPDSSELRAAAAQCVAQIRAAGGAAPD